MSDRDVLGMLADSDDGVYGVDMEHRVVVWNRSAERLLGWSADEVLGKRCYEVLAAGPERPGECGPNCPAIMHARQSRVPPAQTICTRTKGGEAKWLHVAHVVVPSRRPELAVLVHILRDATGEVEASDLVRRLTRFMGQDSRASLAPVTPAGEEQQLLGELSAREREVLRLLAQGYGTQAIAATLYLSPTTVRNHIQRILAKLDVHSRVEAVSRAFRTGLL